MLFFFFFKQKTAYEMRISDWSSDVCSSDLIGHNRPGLQHDNAALALRGNASKLDARDAFHLLFRRRKRRLSEVEGLGFTSFWIDVLDERHGIELPVKDIDPLHEFDGLIEEKYVFWSGNMLGRGFHECSA